MITGRQRKVIELTGRHGPRRYCSAASVAYPFGMAASVMKARSGLGLSDARLSWLVASAARFLVLAALFVCCEVAPCLAASTPDPCVSGSFKQSTSVAITSATTTRVVQAVSGHGIFVCGFALTLNGTSGTATTAQFEYGTQVTNPCDTGTTVLTGPLGQQAAGASTQGTAASVVTSGNGGATVFSAPAGSQLCILSTGSGSSLINGVVTWVQGTGSSYP
jgi:hypothetical protein